MSRYRSWLTGSLTVSLLAALCAVSTGPVAHAVVAEPEILFIRTSIGGVGGTLHRMPAGGGAAAPYILEQLCPCFGTPGQVQRAANPAVSPDGTTLRYEIVHDLGLRFSMLGMASLSSIEELLGWDQGVYAPTWSPDSKTVAFGKRREIGMGATTDIWKVPATTRISGADKTIITTNATSPTYSPTGDRIAFIRVENDGTRAGLWVMNADGTGIAQIPGPVDPADPQWSPDGAKFAYVRSGTSEIYTIPAAGGVPTKIADGVDPSWSPDSTTLVYSHQAVSGGDPAASIYSIVVAGGTPRQLTAPLGTNYTDNAPIFYTAAAKDTTGPGVVPNFTATVTGDVVDLAWVAPADEDWSGVEIRELEGSAAPTITQGRLVFRGRALTARTTVPLGRTFTYAAFAYDTRDNVAAAAATRTVSTVAPAVAPVPALAPTPIPAPALPVPPPAVVVTQAMTAPPLRLPTLVVPSATALTVAAVSFPVSWSAAPQSRFRVRYASRAWTGSRWVTGRWKTWKADTRETSGIFGAGNLPEAPVQGRTYVFDVGVLDARGGDTAARSLGRAAVPLDDTHRAIRYSAGWTRRGAAGHWLGTEHVTTRPGSTATVQSTAQTFVLIGTKGPRGGLIHVYVDGDLMATVNTYSPTVRVRQRLFTSAAAMNNKERTLSLVTGRSGSRSRVVIDAIDVVAR